jgi:hypothetical protein
VLEKLLNQKISKSKNTEKEKLENHWQGPAILGRTYRGGGFMSKLKIKSQNQKSKSKRRCGI